MESITLTINEALAIIGSAVVIVTGLFGYLLKVRSKNGSSNPTTDHDKAHYRIEKEIQKSHTRISEAKDRVAAVESETKLIHEKISTLQKLLREHEERDVTDHAFYNEKLDKVMDILIKMLADEKL